MGTAITTGNTAPQGADPPPAPGGNITPLHRVDVRPLSARDSFDVLTRLLHQAYAPLVEAGMNFTAASQTADDTKRRAAEGQCLVAEQDGRIVGTVTVCGPYAEGVAPWAQSAPWFRDRDTAHFHQLAVHPSLQGQGLGQRLVAACERWALQRGYRRMAVDTAEPATRLRRFYARLGYADVGRLQWDGKHYASVVLQRTLDHSPLRDQLQTLARYNRWATQRLYAQVGALTDADYRRPAGLFFGSIHGTLNHLLVGEHLLWRVRFTEGLSPQLALAAEAEPDRLRLQDRLVDGTLAWLALLDVWPESRLHGRIDYTRMAGQAVSLPFAATLAHVFNHGTHHRGQITAALTAMGRPGPELDLVTMLQQEQPAIP